MSNPIIFLSACNFFIILYTKQSFDSDYRGEAGVLVYNRNPHPFLLHKDMRIAQVIFQKAIIPNLVTVKSYEELSNTARGAGGFGSTGIK